MDNNDEFNESLFGDGDIYMDNDGNVVSKEEAQDLARIAELTKERDELLADLASRGGEPDPKVPEDIAPVRRPEPNTQPMAAGYQIPNITVNIQQPTPPVQPERGSFFRGFFRFMFGFIVMSIFITIVLSIF